MKLPSRPPAKREGDRLAVGKNVAQKPPANRGEAKPAVKKSGFETTS